jgi:hypothetical protein
VSNTTDSATLMRVPLHLAAAVEGIISGRLVAVPLAPTPAMLDAGAGLTADDWEEDPVACNAVHDEHHAIWVAMVDAA